MAENIFKGPLDPMMKPRSVALVGVSGSGDPTNITLTPLLYLKRYKASVKVYVVNPKYREIEGYPCYPSLGEIPEEVDTVLVLVPAKYVLSVVEEGKKKGVKAVIVTTSGFAETGKQGREHQKLLARLAEEARILLLGPNSNGIVNIVDGIPLGFSPALEGQPIRAGGIGFVSQSGATMSALVSRAKEEGMGFSYLISTGNEASLDVCDGIKFLADDEATRVIMLLVEGINDGTKLFKAADYALARHKPIVALKVGRTEMASKAVVSHTGKLAGSYPIYQRAFQQKGILVAEDVDDFLAMAAFLALFPLPRGRGVGILSTSGGGAELVADVAAEQGLVVPELAGETVTRLSEKLRWFSTPKNPFDFAGQVLKDETILRYVIECLSQDPAIDNLIFAMTSILVDERLIRDYLGQVGRQNIPFAFLWLSGAMGQVERKMLIEEGIPICRTARECISGLKALVQYAEFLRKEESPPCQEAEYRASQATAAKLIARDWPTYLNERESKALLAESGIPVTREGLATTAQEACRLASSIGFPVVLKVESREVVHKSEAGGVRLALKNEEEVAMAFAQMLENVGHAFPQARINGILVEEYVPRGREIIVGLVKDGTFGPVVMLGLGGIWTEILKDVTFRVAPITLREAREMIGELKGIQILQGFRGQPAADVEALADILVKVGYFGSSLAARLKEMDINPLLLFDQGQGAKVVDARIIFEEAG